MSNSFNDKMSMISSLNGKFRFLTSFILLLCWCLSKLSICTIVHIEDNFSYLFFYCIDSQHLLNPKIVSYIFDLKVNNDKVYIF